MDSIILCAWLFAPTAFANSAPVLANKIPFLVSFKTPLDLGLFFRGKRIFGDNKSIRGLISGIFMGIVCGLLQFGFASQFQSFANITSIVDYTDISILFYTATIGAGVILGDAFESFFKRQLDIAPGENWIPFDQLDFILGALCVSFFFYTLSIPQYLIVLMLALFLHPTFNIISWLLGFQEKPF
jgi:CDP-2,3-bis-(O-geranylgeranyl)-sn-glycerol synthase